MTVLLLDCVGRLGSGSGIFRLGALRARLFSKLNSHENQGPGDLYQRPLFASQLEEIVRTTEVLRGDQLTVHAKLHGRRRWGALQCFGSTHQFRPEL